MPGFKSQLFHRFVHSKFPAKLYLMLTRKYPLLGYFLGVLIHTTAWGHTGSDHVEHQTKVDFCITKAYLTTSVSKIF